MIQLKNHDRATQERISEIDIRTQTQHSVSIISPLQQADINVFTEMVENPSHLHGYKLDTFRIGGFL